MAFEANTVKIENLALLKFRAAPDRRERWQTRARPAIIRAHSNNHRPMFMRHGVQMIDRFEITGNFLLGRFDDLLFLAVDELLYFRRLFRDAIQPIDSRDVGAKI